MKKVYLIIAIAALIATLTGFSYLIRGIAERGWAGVNYGRIVFPALIGGICFAKYRKM